MNYSEKTDRILAIFFRGLKGEDISVRRLASEFGVTTKTITRDINDLKAFLSEQRELLGYAQLEYSYKSRVYRLNMEGFLLDKELLTLVKILTASRSLNRADMLVLVGKLKAMSSPGDKKLLDRLTDKELYNYHEVGSDISHVIDNLWQLSRLIEMNKEITITYYRMDRKEIIRRIIPASVMFSEYYFYLIAFHMTETGEAVERFYRVDRITNITEHRDRILPDCKYNEGELRLVNQFMFPGKNRKIIFEFRGPSVQAVLDRLPTARLIEVNNGVSTIEARVYGNGIRMWLLSQGDWVKVLEPKELAEEIKETAVRIANMYNI